MGDWEHFHHHRHHHHEHEECPPSATGFIIYQQGVINMGSTPVTPSLTPIDPGNSPQFTAVTTPAGSVLDPGVVPSWTSSDTTNVSVTTDPTGLVATVALSSAITVGEQFTLTISASQLAGPISGSITLTVGAPPPPPPVSATGFSISQTA